MKCPLLACIILTTACVQAQGPDAIETPEPAPSVHEPAPTVPDAEPAFDGPEPGEPSVDATEPDDAPAVGRALSPVGGGGGPITCSFHWRRSDAHGFAAKNEKEIVLKKAGDSRELKLGDTKVAVALDASAAGGHRLTIGVDGGTMRVDDEYDFGGFAAPSNLPPAGHGFTGLSYISPDSGSELQYWCSAGEDPGPAAASGAQLACDVTHVAGGGGRGDAFVVGPADRSASRALGGTEVHASYMPGGAEAGAMILDLGVGGGSARGFYQTHGEALPANLFPGAHGFTGMRTIEDATTGEKLAVSCVAVV